MSTLLMPPPTRGQSSSISDDSTMKAATPATEWITLLSDQMLGR
jgi:hypothetical protein